MMTMINTDVDRVLLMLWLFVVFVICWFDRILYLHFLFSSCSLLCPSIENGILFQVLIKSNSKSKHSINNEEVAYVFMCVCVYVQNVVDVGVWAKTISLLLVEIIVLLCDIDN